MAGSSDAIAIRIIPNPEHYSVSQWYENNGFVGSPQITDIDGYDAIRDGRTAYADIANIEDGGLYTNILIISYTQDPDASTVDIFGQLIKNFRFNTNIPESGKCSVTANAACSYDKDCPAGEYCDSQKAKVIRDVKRLEDMALIKYKLSLYKQSGGGYALLKSGTYIPGMSLSTWPSWQQTLGKQLGSSLPVDPLNRLGDCPGYDPTTCWNEKNLKFASDLSDFKLPAGSHAYLYHSDDNGQTIKYCAQMESGYANLSGSDCFQDKKINNPPNIDSVNLSGTPGKEFIGYVNISDPDNDDLELTADLDTPDRDTWASKNWQWVEGKNNFVVLPTSNPKQKEIYALRTGKYSSIPGYYKIKLSVNDGKGEANSVFSKAYPITFNQTQANVNNVTETAVIGSGISASMSGKDANGDDISQVFFQNADLDGQPLSEAELEDMGFSLSGVSLSERFKAKQKTGAYTVNVSSSDIPGKGAAAAFIYKITNTPPVLNRLTANFSNNTSQTCNDSENCVIAIDNGEAATISLTATDTPGHAINYSLKDNFSNSLKIDASSGKITGLEKLNYKSSSDKTFNVSVKMSDQYCGNSKEEECSSVYSFNILVKGYCSVSDPRTLAQKVFPGPIIVDKSGNTANFGSLDDCSAIGSSTATIKFSGVETTRNVNQAIIPIIDLSASMKTNVAIGGTRTPAIDRLKYALTREDGFFDQIYKIARERRANNLFVKISPIAYSGDIITIFGYGNVETLTNILDSGIKEYLKFLINLYTTHDETNTLAALNEAETRLDGVRDANTDKIVILFSDGAPTVTQYAKYYRCKIDTPSCVCNNYGYSDTPPCPDHSAPRNLVSCPYKITGGGYSDTLFSYWNSYCGACYEEFCPSNCVMDNNAYYQGRYPCICPSVPSTTYNNLWKLKNFLISLLKPKLAQATTAPKLCADTYLNSYEDAAAQCVDPNPNDNTTYQVVDDTDMSKTVLNCDTSDDVLTQAEEMKKKGILIYTVFYNTMGDNDNAVNMCKWSSNNGQNCNNNTYAYSGSNIDTMVQNVISNLTLNKPKNVTVNGQAVVDSDPAKKNSEESIEVKGLACGNINPVVTYENSGSLELSNLTVNYCAARLHP